MCVVLCPGTPECSTASCSGFKASHPTDWEKPTGIEPGLQDIGLYIFVAVFLGCTSTDRVGLCFLWFYVQELPKAQPFKAAASPAPRRLVKAAVIDSLLLFYSFIFVKLVKVYILANLSVKIRPYDLSTINFNKIIFKTLKTNNQMT